MVWLRTAQRETGTTPVSRGRRGRALHRFGMLSGLAIAGFAGAAALAGSATAEEISTLPAAVESPVGDSAGYSPQSVSIPPSAGVRDLVRATVSAATSDTVPVTHQILSTAPTAVSAVAQPVVQLANTAVNSAAAAAGTASGAVTALTEPVLDTTTWTVRAVTDTGAALVAPAVQMVSEVTAPLTATESATQRPVGWVTVTVTSAISLRTPASPATPLVSATPGTAPVAARAADAPAATAGLADAATGAAALSPGLAADHGQRRHIQPLLTASSAPSPLSPIVPIAPAMLPGSAPSSGTSAAQGGSSTSAAIFDGGLTGSRFTTGEPVSDQHLPLRKRADDPSVSPD
ncbi:hypothetical protein DMH03_40670 [Amycolatopsis sp. WAC 01376]|nr:hypothetical protein DMH03_40670 [Amycolatopsis sp. WAC 01376]